MKPAWSARCDCYSGHASASGRCTCRSSYYDGRYQDGVYDPTHREGEAAICAECRQKCLVGNGSVVQPN